MKNDIKDTCLIIEGGGFKTGFTCGVIDAFISGKYSPFNRYIGISGGCVVTSYFLSQQYRFCLDAMLILAKDKNFMKFKRTLGKEGYMDIDFLANVSEEKVPFNINAAIEYLDKYPIHFVATNREEGTATYLNPIEGDWISKVIASCTLPFVTKGKHMVDNIDYFDGGWGDPLPVKWAYAQGAKKILLVRTRPGLNHINQSWSDYFGSWYFKSKPELQQVFETAYQYYNEALAFIESPPNDLIIEQIQPKKLLKSGTYSYSKKTIMRDYRYGVDMGLQYLNSQSHCK